MKKSQEDYILEHFQQGNTLTPLEALEKFQTFRLGARCYDLKQKGYNIQSKMVKNLKTGKHYAEYFLEK